MQMIFSILAILLAVSYGAYLFAHRPRRLSSFVLAAGLLACVVLEFCDLRALLDPTGLAFWKRGALLAESCLPGFWLLFALVFSRSGGWREMSWLSRLLLFSTLAFPLAALLLPPTTIFYSPDFADEKMLFLGSAGYFFYVALMAFLVVALAQLERTLVALPRPDRWRIKFEVMGASVLLAVLVVYYSQALLYRSLDMNLLPVRSFSLALGVGLMAFSRLRRGEAVRIRVSREIAYRSVVVLVVGCYLILLGIFGAGMRYLHVSGNRPFFVGLAVLAGFALVMLLLSERIRRRIQVLLHKNFYQQKYDYRNEWLQFTSKLAGAHSREELEKGVLEFYAETFSLRGAALFLRDREGGCFRCSACFENEAEQLCFEEGYPIMTRMGGQDWVIGLDEEDESLFVGDWARLRAMGASFLVPLRFENTLEGFIVLGRRIYQQERLTYEDFDLMKILAHQTIGVLLSRKLYTDLAAANEMAAIGRVSTFVIHDLKNLVSGLALVVDNARDYIDDPEFRGDMFETLEHTVDNMKTLIARLQNVKHHPLLDRAPCDLLAVAKEGAALAGAADVEIAGTPALVLGDAAELCKVVVNLLHNAREAAAGHPPRVEVGCAGQAFLRVVDQGCGMSEEFIRARLFRPFETTKKKGMGIGLYQCRQVIEGHGGRIEVRSTPGEGSVFTVWLPTEEEAAG